MTEPCLFCRIVAGEIPATVVSEGPQTLAFRDIDPQAPTHVLVIPRRHFADVATLAAADGNPAHRLVFNSGAEAGQSVFHVHGHVLAGRPLAWPPG
jgi:histidine triad (HIT) family protein